MSNVSIIFTPEPDQWGLRGDPFLWQLLKERYQAGAGQSFIKGRQERRCGDETEQ